jgi:hypothetical protein
MRRLWTVLALGAFLAAPLSAVDINCDITNVGTATAYDVAIVLAGMEQIGITYDGWPFHPDHRFRSFTKSYTGANTVLHWQSCYDETKTPPVPTSIPPGTTIHVGYTTADHTSTIIDFYWTDQNGGRILGGGIAITGGHIDVNGVTFSNALRNLVSISNARFVILPQPRPLSDLTIRNDELMASLQPFPGPAGITLQPGESFSLPFPQPLPPGATAIVVYDTSSSAEGANAGRVTNFMQDTP